MIKELIRINVKNRQKIEIIINLNTPILNLQY